MAGPNLLTEYYGSGNVNNTYRAVAISTGTFLWWNGSAWTRSLYSSAISNDPISSDPVDATVIFDVNNAPDDNALVFVTPTNYAYIWPGPHASSGNTFSTLTAAPAGAMAVAFFDERVVFANSLLGGVGGIRLPQRITWSGRGDPWTYAEPDGGGEDITSMRGEITKMIPDGDRLIVFSQDEIWQGLRAAFPFDLQFFPLDRSVGCGDPRTVQSTPSGIVFQGSDFNVYLLPKGGAAAVPIGNAVWPLIKRDQDITIVRGVKSFAVFDKLRGEYELFPSTVLGASRLWPNRSYVCGMTESVTWSSRSYTDRFSSGVMLKQEIPTGGPVTYFSTSSGTIVRVGDSFGFSVASASTMDMASAFSSTALFPIGNPDPREKVFINSVIVDYSNYSCPSGSSITIACSDDFGQTYGLQVGVALPHTLISRQTVVNLQYSAMYPSIELRYSSQVSGNFLRIQRVTALVETVGTPGVGSA